mgnify:CR=1 FL=1
MLLSKMERNMNTYKNNTYIQIISQMDWNNYINEIVISGIENTGKKKSFVGGVVPTKDFSLGGECIWLIGERESYVCIYIMPPSGGLKRV